MKRVILTFAVGFLTIVSVKAFSFPGVAENVIPAKAGSQKALKLLDPRFRGDDKSAFPTTPFPGWVTGKSGEFFFETDTGDKIAGIYGPAFQDLLRLQKMAPPGAKKGLEIHPPVGGIEGLTPVYGTLRYDKEITFQWGGKPLKGERPVLVFMESHQQKNFVFELQRKSRLLKASSKLLDLERGKEYRWYLGRKEGYRIIAQSRVFFFRMLDKREEERLRTELAGLQKIALEKNSVAADFLTAQIYYKYRLYHDMVALLEPIYNINPSLRVKQLLYLGYLRLGRHATAEKYNWERKK